MKDLFCAVATIAGAIILATLLAGLSGCASASDRQMSALRSDIGNEQNDRIDADTAQRQILERQFAEIQKLQKEYQHIQGTLLKICANQPELCKEPKELQNWR